MVNTPEASLLFHQFEYPCKSLKKKSSHWRNFSYFCELGNVLEIFLIELGLIKIFGTLLNINKKRSSSNLMFYLLKISIKKTLNFKNYFFNSFKWVSNPWLTKFTKLKPQSYEISNQDSNPQLIKFLFPKENSFQSQLSRKINGKNSSEEKLNIFPFIKMM